MGQMRRTTTVELRLDHRKAASSGIGSRAIRGLAANGDGCDRISLRRRVNDTKITLTGQEAGERRTKPHE
jgi:hypothetical protein